MPITLVMLAIFVAMVGIAWGYPAQSRFLPLLIGIPGIGLTLVQLFQDIRKKVEAPKTDTRQEIVLFGYFAGLVVGVILFGFWWTAPVFLVLFLRWHEQEKWWFVASLTATAWLVIYVVFDLLLEITLHGGFLTEYLRG